MGQSHGRIRYSLIVNRSQGTQTNANMMLLFYSQIYIWQSYFKDHSPFSCDPLRLELFWNQCLLYGIEKTLGSLWSHGVSCFYVGHNFGIKNRLYYVVLVSLELGRLWGLIRTLFVAVKRQSYAMFYLPHLHRPGKKEILWIVYNRL